MSLSLSANMGLGLGYRASSGGSAFSPLDLFTSSEVGAWYDPSDLSTLWQDSAGTIAVTADGDPVGRVDDKSGNGHHYTQTLNPSRPTYKTDGTYHWLATDGVDDYLDASISGFTSSMYDIIGFERDASEVQGILCKWSSATEASMLFDSVGTASAIGVGTPDTYVNGVIIGSLRSDLLTALTADTPKIVETTNLVVNTQTSHRYAYFESGVFYTLGKFYGRIFRQAMSAQERSDAQAYMASKSGVTL